MTPERLQSLHDEYRAFASLALTQRRLAWAAHKRAKGRATVWDNPDASEARRLWRAAKEHLSFARLRKDIING